MVKGGGCENKDEAAIRLQSPRCESRLKMQPSSPPMPKIMYLPLPAAAFGPDTSAAYPAASRIAPTDPWQTPSFR